MEIKIYAIFCSKDLQKISCASAPGYPSLTISESKALLETVKKNTESRIFTPHATTQLLGKYKSKLSHHVDRNQLHLFSYHDVKEGTAIERCFTIIGSENINDLSEFQMWMLGRNILDNDKLLSDIIKEPNKHTNKFICTISEETEHVEKFSNQKDDTTEDIRDTQPPQMGCNFLCSFS